jgi:hypothetical protein
MIWLLWKLLTLPIRLVLGTLGTVVRTVRFFGIGRLAAFGAGVGVGLALEPRAGEQFRARIGVARPGSPPVSAVDLASAVRDELAHSPRTWHLPQPVVTAAGNRITLTGEVPHDEARADLLRTAGAVHGVGAVDDRITVAAP